MSVWLTFLPELQQIVVGYLDFFSRQALAFTCKEQWHRFGDGDERLRENSTRFHVLFGCEAPHSYLHRYQELVLFNDDMLSSWVLDGFVTRADSDENANEFVALTKHLPAHRTLQALVCGNNSAFFTRFKQIACDVLSSSNQYWRSIGWDMPLDESAQKTFAEWHLRGNGWNEPNIEAFIQLCNFLTTEQPNMSPFISELVQECISRGLSTYLRRVHQALTVHHVAYAHHIFELAPGFIADEIQKFHRISNYARQTLIHVLLDLGRNELSNCSHTQNLFSKAHQALQMYPLFNNAALYHAWNEQVPSLPLTFA